ncbi:MAG TPA: preprotein translocase subunit SecE [Candidatus Paceibacterota bacterium]|jgi:preprotein translocase subunit SecE|nr:preprotein translocase subunit SecE [Candidatus Paceibacterota bacterium]
MFKKIKQYFKSSYKELKQVNWPTKKEVAKYTMEVLVLAFLVALVLGLIDYGLMQLMRELIK